MFKHGDMRKGHRTKEASIWLAMHDRCSNPKNKSFANYGGRGITVCERWSGPDGFLNFLSDMGRKPEGMSIDRIDNSKGYSPGNCKWATRKEQQRNNRNARIVLFRGEERCLAEWAEVLGMPIKTIYKRIHLLGWDTDRALSEPCKVGSRPKIYEIDGCQRSLSEWANVSGTPLQMIRDRLRLGWDIKSAVFKKHRSQK